MPVQYYTATTLNGFLATEEDSLEWLFSLKHDGSEAALDQTSYPDFIRGVGAIVMGAATYEWILKNVDSMVAETGSPWPYTQPTWVFTTRHFHVPPGAKIHFVQGDVSKSMVQIRAAAGAKNIWIVGGGDLAGQFLDAGFLDEIILHMASVTLASGKPLLPRTVLSPRLKLQSVDRLGTHMVELRYSVEGVRE